MGLIPDGKASLRLLSRPLFSKKDEGQREVVGWSRVVFRPYCPGDPSSWRGGRHVVHLLWLGSPVVRARVLFVEALDEGVREVEVEVSQHPHHAFTFPAPVAHDEFAHQARVVARSLGPQRLLRICSQNDNVVVRRAIHDEFDVVNTSLVRSTVPTCIRVSSNRAYLPASPAEVSP